MVLIPTIFSLKRSTEPLKYESNQVSLGVMMRTLEKGVGGRRAYRSGGQNPLGILQVKMNAP